MPELADVLATNLFNRKVHIHDTADEGLTLQLDSGVEVIYPCSPVSGFEVKSDGALWDYTTGKFNDSTGVLFQSINVKWSFVINVGNAQSVTLNIVIPDAGGDIPVYQKVYTLASGDNALSNTTMFYLGAEALVAGFEVTLTPSVNMDIKARSILVMTS
jgi:hypothetical protein